jgi:hypothetical protein
MSPIPPVLRIREWGNSPAAAGVPTHEEDDTMRAPIFGLSTAPVPDAKSEVRLQIERDLLALVYRSPR